jgi:hypothetical protein
LAQWCVIGTTLLAVACGRTASTEENQRSAGPEAVKIDDVDIRTKDSDLTVFYRTRTPIRDGKAQALEMPKVWELVVKPRLKDSSVKQVILFPEDASRQSVGVAFTKSATGEWIARAPWRITIPAG